MIIQWSKKHIRKTYVAFEMKLAPKPLSVVKTFFFFFLFISYQKWTRFFSESMASSSIRIWSLATCTVWTAAK